MSINIGGIASIIVGALLAAVSVVGLVNSQVNSTAQNAGSVTKSNIDYGTNG